MILSIRNWKISLALGPPLNDSLEPEKKDHRILLHRTERKGLTIIPGFFLPSKFLITTRGTVFGWYLGNMSPGLVSGYCEASF